MTNEEIKNALINKTPVTSTTADGVKVSGTLYSIRYTRNENGGIRISVEIADKMNRLTCGNPQRLEMDNG